MAVFCRCNALLEPYTGLMMGIYCTNIMHKSRFAPQNQALKRA